MTHSGTQGTERPAGILLVEDDPDIASALKRGLEAERFNVSHCAQISGALERLRATEVDAAIVDVMVGEENGLDLVAEARRSGIQKPIIMLSALADVDDRTRGIAAGANDYVVKPFVFSELLARLRVQILADASAKDVFSLDAVTNSATYRNETIQLTEREFQLLSYLSDHPGQPVSRWTLYDALWAGDGHTSENVVDVYIGYLRKKLASFTVSPAPEIKTIRNKGFLIRFS